MHTVSLKIVKNSILMWQRSISWGSRGPLISNIHFVYIELWDATGHPKGLVAVGCSLDRGDQGSLSFFLTQITDLNYWPLIRCMKLVLR